MVIDGTKYFKLAYLKAAQKQKLGRLAYSILKLHEIRMGGHDFTKDDLPYIETKLKQMRIKKPL